MIIVGLALAILVVILVMAIVSHNRFVRQRQLIDDSWSDVDTELRRRYDLVPNLVATVKGYAAHESTTLEAVTSARAQAVASTGPPAEQAAPENTLVTSLRSLLAVSEAYPALEADQQFLALQGELVTTEDRIQATRRWYNGNVRSYNQRVQSFPSNVVARLFGYTPRDYFKIAEAVGSEAPAVGFAPDAD